MKNKHFLWIAFLLTLSIGACKKGGKTGLLVPKDANMVIHVDLTQLGSKLSWKEIQQTQWFSALLEKTQDSLSKKILSNPDQSGLDTHGDLLFFMKRKGQQGYLAVQGKLTNSQQFAQMIAAAGKGSTRLGKEGDLQVITQTEGKSGVIYFNDKQFILVSDASSINPALNPSKSPQRSSPYGLDSLKYFARQTLGLKGEELLDSDPRFEGLILDKADAHYWMNLGDMFAGSLPSMLSLLKLTPLLENNIGAGKMNFENGRLTLDAKNYYSKELTDLLKKYHGQNVDQEMVTHLPQSGVLAAFAVNYPPEGLQAFLKLLGVDGIVNAALGQIGIHTDDLIKGGKGDLAFALTNVKLTHTPATVKLDDGEKIGYDKEDMDMDFVVGASVNDKTSFQKLIDAFGSKLKGQRSMDDSLENNFKYQLQDKWFVWGSSDSMIHNFLTANNTPAYAQPFTAHNGAGYFDLQKILQTIRNNNRDTSQQAVLDRSLNFWKNATMYWDIKNGEVISNTQINLVNGNNNFLKQLNQYIDELYQLAPPKKQDNSQLPALAD